MREAFGPPHNPAERVEQYVAGAFTPDRLRADLADPRSTFLLAEDAHGNVAGYARLVRHRPPRRMTERNAIEIERIYLLEHHIGRGAGRQLMEHCLDVARAENYRAVWLGVWEHNHRARQFYERLGFTPFGWHYFQFGDDRQRDIWLQKPL